MHHYFPFFIDIASIPFQHPELKKSIRIYSKVKRDNVKTTKCKGVPAP